MADLEGAKAQPDKWELDHEFEDADGVPIGCGRADCKLGSYVIERTSYGTSYAPACTTCGFTGDLDNVFNPDEPRYEPGAPEDYKRGAARVLATDPDSPIDAIQTGRPDTAAMIDTYAAID